MFNCAVEFDVSNITAPPARFQSLRSYEDYGITPPNFSVIWQDLIPHELRLYDQWVLWDMEARQEAIDFRLFGQKNPPHRSNLGA